MKTADVEALVRAHFQSEVEAARLGHPDRTHGAPRWVRILAAAAAITLIPISMVAGRSTLRPLSSIIDREWNASGRTVLVDALASVNGVLSRDTHHEEELK